MNCQLAAQRPGARPAAAVRCSSSSRSSDGRPSSAPEAKPAQSPPLGPPPPQQQREQERAAPWALTPYHTKKRERRTDALGNMLHSPDMLAEPLGWTPDAQLRLAAEALAGELQTDAETLLDQVRQLQALLPSMEATLQQTKPADLLRMAAQLEQITARLLALRQRFASADVGAMVAGHPPLLHMSAGELDAAVEAVRSEFPDLSSEELEMMLSANPALLDGGENLAACLRSVGDLLTKQQIARSLARDPSFLFQFQALQRQSRGDRDADYLSDMFKAGS